jgi:hypothetical protein
MKTTLMELITLLEKDFNSGMLSHDEQFGYDVAIDMAKELLDKEKNNLIDAFEIGYKDGHIIKSNDFYNKLYNQNK